MWGHGKKMIVCEPGSRASPDTESASTLIVDFTASRTKKKKATQSMVLGFSSLNRLRQGWNEIPLYIPVIPAFFLLLEHLRTFPHAVPSYMSSSISHLSFRTQLKSSSSEKLLLLQTSPGSFLFCFHCTCTFLPDTWPHMESNNHRYDYMMMSTFPTRLYA